MRQMILFLAIPVLLLIIMGLGCDESPEESGIVNVTITNTSLNDCWPSTDPCSKSFWLSFKDTKNTSQDLYYWPEFDTPYGTYKGKWVKRFNAGGTISMKATANYFGFSYADSCELLIGSSFTVEDAVKKNATRRRGHYQGLVYVPDFDPDCFRNCCTDSSSGGEERYKAVAAKDIGEVVGVKAAIETHWGKLCGEDVECTDLGLSAAWVGIQEEFGLPGAWVQVGYHRLRRQDSVTIDPALFLEFGMPACFPGSILIRKFSPLPLEGENHNYELIIDADADTIHFRYDFQVIHSLVLTPCNWLSSTGHWAVWSGEIAGYETDMPGTSNDSCNFVGCEYRRHNEENYTGAQFQQPPDIIGTNDLSEWKINFTNGFNDFEIWDIHPLP